MLSVIIPTHNPHATRLARTLDGLRRQSLPVADWELILIDNASDNQTVFDSIDLAWHGESQIVREPRLGLTAARVCGIRAARGTSIVFVDDDNVLAPDYLDVVHRWFESQYGCGAIGGRSEPEFERPPADWVRGFDGLLALRDLGPERIVADWKDAPARAYPTCAPIGAGMAIRREAALAYVTALEHDPIRRSFDRTGKDLTSGGDNDLVMTVLEAGYSVGYLPELRLTHLIPANRCGQAYLGALNRAIARSWVRVLALHGIRPWKPVRRSTVRLRQMRAWIRLRAWAQHANWVEWQGACGQFEGLADLATA